MRKTYFLSIVLAGGLFFGCSIKEVKLPEVHKIEVKSPRAYTCNPTHFVEKYSEEQQKVAVDYFLYALFSSNNYDDETYFSVPNWKRVKRYTAQTGFSADVYEKTVDSKIEEVVIAFKGTSFSSWRDWFFANFSITDGGQFENARNLYKIISNDKRYTSVNKVLTGHSLGGGLALHVSAHLSTEDGNVSTYVFDASPRVFVPKKTEITNNKRVIIREKGEILEYVSRVWKSKKLSNEKYTYDFFTNGKLGDHKMYALARGLLLMATVNNDKLAIKIQNAVAHCEFKFDENETK